MDATTPDAIEARQKAAASARWEIIGGRDGPRALMALLGEDVPALVAEVRGLTEEAREARALTSIHSLAMLKAQERAEAAEAEVGTLRARLAEAEALHWKVGGACSHCSQRSDYAVAWPCETAVALAGTTGEGE